MRRPSGLWVTVQKEIALGRPKNVLGDPRIVLQIILPIKEVTTTEVYGRVSHVMWQMSSGERCKMQEWFPTLKKKIENCFPVFKNAFAATLNFKSCAKLFSKTQLERRGSEDCAPPQWGLGRASSGSWQGSRSCQRFMSSFPARGASGQDPGRFFSRPPPSTNGAEGTRHHHRSHLFFGFMGAPALQPKCLEKSRELDMVPMTRNLDGLWGSVMTPSCELSGVLAEHHTCRRHEWAQCRRSDFQHTCSSPVLTMTM